MFSQNNRKSAIKKLKSLVFTSNLEIDNYRQKIEENFATPILPNKVTFSSKFYNSTECDVLIPEAYLSKRIILYIHGGCFVGGSRASWRGFCASLANICSSRVIIPEFRLSPASAYPSAIEDILSCLKALYVEEELILSLEEDSEEKSIPEIIIAADGSGATQALAVLLKLEEKYKKGIKQVILFSPWLNLSHNSELIKNKKSKDELISADCLKRSSDVYTYSSNLENPLISPIFADDNDLKNFPPVHIQMGEKEILLSDAIKFQKKLQKNEIPCTLDVWKNMMFMFQMADEYVEESHLALEKIGKLVTTRNKTTENTLP